MATKDEMIQDITSVIHRHAGMLEFMKLPPIKVFEWLEHVSQDYATLRRANRFVFSRFSKALDNANAVWHCVSKDVWTSLYLIAPDSNEVRLLKEHTESVKEYWKNRPKKVKRGNE